MLTVLPPSCTLTDESLQELLSSGSSDTAGSTASPSEACYLIFFSSTLPALPSRDGEEGLPLRESDLASLKEGLWCPDCRAALQPVLSVFQPGALPPATATAEEVEEPRTRALLVQVSREQWKDRSDGGHFYRKRYDVQSVPTILKWLGVSYQRKMCTGCRADQVLLSHVMVCCAVMCCAITLPYRAKRSAG